MTHFRHTSSAEGLLRARLVRFSAGEIPAPAAEGEPMRLQVKGKNLDVSDSIRSYAEEKLAKLERQLADPTQIELELSVERNPSISANHIAEATIWTKGPT